MPGIDGNRPKWPPTRRPVLATRAPLAQARGQAGKGPKSSKSGACCRQARSNGPTLRTGPVPGIRGQRPKPSNHDLALACCGSAGHCGAGRRNPLCSEGHAAGALPLSYGSMPGIEGNRPKRPPTRRPVLATRAPLAQARGQAGKGSKWSKIGADDRRAAFNSANSGPTPVPDLAPSRRIATLRCLTRMALRAAPQCPGRIAMQYGRSKPTMFPASGVRAVTSVSIKACSAD